MLLAGSVRAGPPALAARTFSTWTQLASAPLPLSNSSATALDGKIYYVGNRNGPARGEALASYDPAADAWTIKKDAPVHFSSPSSCALKGKLYVLGMESGDFLAYNPMNDQWTRKASLKLRRGRCVGAFEGRLYAAEDSEMSYDTGHVFSYDPTTDVWSQVESDVGQGAVVIGDTIYGTQKQPQSLKIGDFEWRNIAAADNSTMQAVVAVGSRLYAIGGALQDTSSTANGSNLGTVLEYDPAENMWTPRRPVGRFLFKPAAAALGDTIYLINEQTLLAYTPSRKAAEAVAAVEPEVRRPNDFALVVGVDAYRSLPASPGAAKDAAAMASRLRSAIGLPKENILLLTRERAGRADIAGYLDEWLPKNLTSDSRLYFYFSGYGAVDPADKASYILPWDADMSFLRSTAYPMTELFAKMESLNVREVVMFFDCCFGAQGDRCREPQGVRPLVAYRDASPGRSTKLTVFFATSHSERAGATADGGLFTGAVSRALTGATADGSLTALELHRQIRQSLRAVGPPAQSPRLVTATPDLRIY